MPKAGPAALEAVGARSHSTGSPHRVRSNPAEETTMSKKDVIMPGPAHPITSEASPDRVVVRAGG